MAAVYLLKRDGKQSLDYAAATHPSARVAEAKVRKRHPLASFQRTLAAGDVAFLVRIAVDSGRKVALLLRNACGVKTPPSGGCD